MSFFVQSREKPYDEINKLLWEKLVWPHFLCPQTKNHSVEDNLRIALHSESLALDKYPHLQPALSAFMR